MFKLLKNLKNSNYYYYEDFEEDSQYEADEEAALAETKSLNGAVQSVDEMTTRLEALKNQVELLKKSNGKETHQLKKQLENAIKEKESLELQSQVDSKKSDFYKNLEMSNELLEKQLAGETAKVKQLQVSLTEVQNSKEQLSVSLKEDEQTQDKVKSLEEELATTKRQLIKYIKHEKSESQNQAIIAKNEQRQFAQEMSELRGKLLATKEEANILFSEALKNLKSSQSNSQQTK